MFYVSEIMKSAPMEFETELQKLVYTTLQALNIPFERVDTDEAITMDDCVVINQKLDMQMVKTLFCAIGNKPNFIYSLRLVTKFLSRKILVMRLAFPEFHLLRRNWSIRCWGHISVLPQ